MNIVFPPYILKHMHDFMIYIFIKYEGMDLKNLFLIVIDINTVRSETQNGQNFVICPR